MVRRPLLVLVLRLLAGTKILTVYDFVPDSEPKVVEVPFGTPYAIFLQQAGVSRAETMIYGRSLLVVPKAVHCLSPCWIRPTILIHWKKLAQLLVLALSNCCLPIPVWLHGRWSVVAILRKEIMWQMCSLSSGCEAYRRYS